jgi:hypothetical protein
MKTKSCLIVSAMSLILFSCATVSSAQTDDKKIVQRVTAAQVNGVYRFYKSTFRVLALGNNKLKVQFAGVYENIMKNVNVGYTEGIATIEGNVATLVPEGTTGCKFTMTFLPGKLVVKQEGADYECGFGHNVYATGTYKRIRSGKPKFQPPP